MTSTYRKGFNYCFMHFKTKARNPGNTVAATNLVVDPLMKSNDL